MAYVKGTEGHDVLTGSADRDTLEGLGGNDTFTGGAGMDLLIGGAGNDLFHLEGGDDVNGNDGIDTASFGKAFSAFKFHYSGSGDLYIEEVGQFGSTRFGASSQDTEVFLFTDKTIQTFADVNVSGTAAGEAVGGYFGNDTVHGLDGDDTLGGLAGNDCLVGGAGNDFLVGGFGDDTMLGGDGDDVFAASTYDSDSLDGGAGSDTAKYYDYLGTQFTINKISATHFEVIQDGGYKDVLKNFEFIEFGGGKLLDLSTYEGTKPPEVDPVQIGDAGNNMLFGTTGDDFLYGQAGNDTLYGGAGNDRLHGGPGADHLYGKLGDDTYVVDTYKDVVYEDPNAGNDTVISNVSYNLKANVENLILRGSANTNGAGTHAANRIAGNHGNNLLSGKGGNDTITGGKGNDTLIGARGDAGFGAKEKDILTGGAGADLFILGTKSRVYYSNANHADPGKGDYAFITDFNAAQGDKLRLKGDADDYFLGGGNPVGGAKAKALYFDSDGNGTRTASDELIAVIRGNNVSLQTTVDRAHFV